MENIKPVQNVGALKRAPAATKTATKTPVKVGSRPATAGAVMGGAVAATPSTPFSPNASMCSTSSARESAKMAKLTNTAERIKRVGDLKEKWVKEKEDKVTRNAEKRAVELQRLRELTQASAEQRRIAVSKAKEQEQQTKQARLESAAQAAADRAFQKSEIEKQTKSRRRMSVLLNAEIKAKAAENEKKLAAHAKAREDDILATRREGQLDIRAAKKQEGELRRQSLAFRATEQRAAREKETSMLAAQQEEDRDLVESRHQAWLDEQAAKAEEAKRQREDLAHRLEAWRVTRTVEEEATEKEREDRRRLLEERRLDWQAKETYKKSQADRDRQSVSQRLQLWRDHQSAEALRAQQQEEEEEAERELQHAAAEDVRRYQQDQKRRERESLLLRSGKAQQDKKSAMDEALVTKAREAQDRELSLQANRDAEGAREEQRKRQRQSLACSLVAAKRAHEVRPPLVHSPPHLLDCLTARLSGSLLLSPTPINPPTDRPQPPLPLPPLHSQPGRPRRSPVRTRHHARRPRCPPRRLGRPRCSRGRRKVSPPPLCRDAS